MIERATLTAVLIAGLLAFGVLQVGGEPVSAAAFPADPAHIEDKLAEDRVRILATSLWISEAQLLADLASSGEIHLPIASLGGGISLAPHDLRGPNYQAYAIGDDGQTYSMGAPDLGTYRGFLSANPLQSAVFTIVPDFVHGIIHNVAGNQHVLTIDTPLPAERNADGLLHVEVRETPESTDDAGKEQGPGTDPTVGAVGEYTTIPFESLNLGAAQGWSRPTTSINFDALTHSDGEFYNLGTSTVYSRAATNLNDADTHFYNQLRVGFSIANQWTFTSNNQPSSTTDCYTLKSDVETNSDTYIPISTNPRDFMVFFSHRNLSGDTIGCAWEPGIQNPDDLGYAVVQTYNLNTAEEQEVTMHEVGHLFHGEHQYARKWRDSSCLWFCHKGTIMIDEGLGNLFEFSEGDDLKYNSYRVRYCAEHVSSCNGMASPSKNAAEQLFL